MRMVRRCKDCSFIASEARMDAHVEQQGHRRGGLTPARRQQKNGSAKRRDRRERRLRETEQAQQPDLDAKIRAALTGTSR